VRPAGSAQLFDRKRLVARIKKQSVHIGGD
jgi:hypothetical protein